MDRLRFDVTFLVVLLLVGVKESLGGKLLNKRDIRAGLPKVQDPKESIKSANVEEESDYVECSGMPVLGAGVLPEFAYSKSKPGSCDIIKTEFYFSSTRDRTVQQIQPWTKLSLRNDFDPARKTVFIVHGFRSKGSADWVLQMVQAYQDLMDVNVFTVDWSNGCNFWQYWQAAANVRTVGADIARFINQLKINVKQCHIIGHSLGAHVAGFAGKKLNKIERITGLDPALPCFNTTDSKQRLDTSDADFVDVIHTSGDGSSILGTPYRYGHVDFYPNGGAFQPGCEAYISTNQAICSHERSCLFFIESLTKTTDKFEACPWDLTRTGLDSSIKMHKDKSASCTVMGIHTPPTTRGAFILATDDKTPFSVMDWGQRLKPDNVIDVQALPAPKRPKRA